MEHSHHPLYAFLQSSASKSVTTPHHHDDHSPREGMVDSTKSNGDATKHLISLITTVRAHSTQLDQMVNHLNSLVSRVESVETIFSEGQEQVHQMVTKFQSDATTMALQTGDRVNGTLQPALNSFNHSISSLSQQLESIRTNSEKHANTQRDHGLSLSQISRDVQHLSHQVNQMDARLTIDKLESSNSFESLEKVFKSLNSALEPNSVLVPLLQAFLQSQLRSTSTLQEPITKVTPRVSSSGGSMRRHRGENNGIVQHPETSSTEKSTDPANTNDLVEGLQRKDQIEAERLANVNQSPNPFKKNPVEHEPTVTQESTIDSSWYREDSQAEERLNGAALMVESSTHVKRRSIGEKVPERELRDTQQDSISRLDYPDDIMRTNSRKRSRSIRSPEFETKLHRSNSILTQRKVSFKRIQASTIASKNDLQSQLIKETETYSVLHEKPVKKNRRPLLMEDGGDTVG